MCTEPDTVEFDYNDDNLVAFAPCIKCRQAYCRNCLNTWIIESKRCPGPCRAEFKITRSNPAIIPWHKRNKPELAQAAAGSSSDDMAEMVRKKAEQAKEGEIREDFANALER